LRWLVLSSGVASDTAARTFGAFPRSRPRHTL